MSLIRNHPGIVLGLVLVVAEAGLAAFVVSLRAPQYDAWAPLACVGAGLLFVAGSVWAYRWGNVQAARWIALAPVLLPLLLPWAIGLIFK